MANKDELTSSFPILDAFIFSCPIAVARPKAYVE